MTTKLVNIKHDPYDVYIGRGSVWGNPYTHIKDRITKAKYIVSTRKESIEKYELYLQECINNESITIQQLRSLVGRVLGCHCKPKSCHGEIIIKFVQRYCMDEIFKQKWSKIK